MRIWTSRYGNAELAKSQLRKIGITLGEPKFPVRYDYKTLFLLAPPRTLWGLPHEDFAQAYKARLDKIGVARIRRELEKITNGEDAVLLCFEDVRKEFCHRRVFAEWWEEKTGEKVEELEQGELPVQLKLF